ncbi:VOC family protein [Actinomadura rayongensis]|uniref:VOC family protein n=2 Tax=Actinomadura rayongensis TaxID=1429076 RepID=A0A6I4W3X5_9ACTN|nr:VOC family protein [Actinomadura rayongensis]MXQ64111.1 VOC family protein [Actinomadura rayongensis]
MRAFVDRPAELRAEAVRFWAAVTGTEPADGGLLVPAKGDAHVEVRSGAALALEVADVEAALTVARALGAEAIEAGETEAVVRSPGGTVFRLEQWSGAAERSPVVGDADVFQVCVDVPAAAFDEEVAFWSRWTGWPSREAARPEFAVVQPPDAMPFRLLIQRLEDGGPGAHLDLACPDRAATRARHEELGARALRELPWWTVMEDPAGGTYCLIAARPAS